MDELGVDSFWCGHQPEDNSAWPGGRKWPRHLDRGDQTRGGSELWVLERKLAAELCGTRVAASAAGEPGAQERTESLGEASGRMCGEERQWETDLRRQCAGSTGNGAQKFHEVPVDGWMRAGGRAPKAYRGLIFFFFSELYHTFLEPTYNNQEA